MALNTIIVDDEKPAREELAYLLKAFPDINVIGQGKNGVEAVALIKEHAPDLVFLDVQMPGLDGFGVLKKLVERKVRKRLRERGRCWIHRRRRRSGWNSS